MAHYKRIHVNREDRMFKIILIALVVFSVCSASDQVKISSTKKIAGWTLIASGVCMGAVSISNIPKEGITYIGGTDCNGKYTGKSSMRDRFYGVTLYFSIVPIISGVKLLIK
jgi:hypothetical protein